MTNVQRAEEKGYQAGLAGKPKSQNPHKFLRECRAGWNSGWKRGREARKLNIRDERMAPKHH